MDYSAKGRQRRSGGHTPHGRVQGPKRTGDSLHSQWLSTGVAPADTQPREKPLRTAGS